MSANDLMIRRALLSVSDKHQLIPLAKALHQHNIEILSTGGTAELLLSAGIPVIEVSNYTDYPEIMGGRVKTLHPKIHGGILGRRDQDQQIMQQQQIPPIDLVIVNLYPFQKAIEQVDCSKEQAIENIDIGGPTLIRAAAKNHQYVTVIVDPADYPQLIRLLEKNAGTIPFDYRFNLAVKAFEHTANYDAAIANHFGKTLPPYSQVKQPTVELSQPLTEPCEFPRTLHLNFIKQQDLRYGENAHQTAALYLETNNDQHCVANATQLQGKPLSYNNLADSDAAFCCVSTFTLPACVIVKHANPCGVATGKDLTEAYLRAFTTDPTSAFGGIIAFNQLLDEQAVKTILTKQFVEVIIAPEITDSARALLETKANIRLLISGYTNTPARAWDFKRIQAGLLVQQYDNTSMPIDNWQVVTQRTPTEAEKQDALFAWQVAKFVKSNAIVYAKMGTTLGIGAGQMSRVDSAKIALHKAQEQQFSLEKAVMASDAFFPFRDSIDFAAKAGISCIIQPGGSIRDQEVIDAANQYQIAMLFTGIRHFRH